MCTITSVDRTQRTQPAVRLFFIEIAVAISSAASAYPALLQTDFARLHKSGFIDRTRSGFACHSDQVRKDSGFEFIHLFDYHHPTTRSEGNRRNVRSLIYFSLAETRRLTTTCMKRRKREMNSFLLGVSRNHIPNWSSGHSVRFVDTPRRQTNQLWLTNVFKYSETDATWSSMWTTCWQHDRCLIVLLLLCQGW